MASADLLPSVHRLDADAYGRMVAAGFFAEERIELIDGLLIEMSPQSPVHAGLVSRLTHHLAGADALLLRVQLGLHVADDAVLEPDLALVPGPERFDAHPHTAALVVEVSVSSLSLDRGRKAELYAAAGVGEYWIVDVEARGIEVGSEPGAGGFDRVRVHRAGDVVPSPVPGVPDLLVAELFAGVPAGA